ncbi:MAG: prephenate dehydrogenase/arogenate dehydrogenase family protein [Deltaproteobacteria bacterium]|nr:prephenate dehydrogenase/arogenate dehydrogenase family protein [Deltaproteobacteria bacterium]
MKELESLRQEIDQIDSDILKLSKKRFDMAKKIGLIKAKSKQPTRDFEREKQCLEQAKQSAKQLKLSKNFAQSVLKSLIHESLVCQEKDRIAQNADSNQSRALIIGGAGQMGHWFAQFLSSQGFFVEIADKASSKQDFPNVYPWQNQKLEHDVIIVATPLSVTQGVLSELAKAKPTGLVIDIASLKEPVRKGLNELKDAGAKVASLHPMFGPDTELLSGKHVILVDLGNSQANQEAVALFEPTMAKITSMSIDEHDKIASILLGLSHAINIAFFTTLERSGESTETLLALSSTTFNDQLEVASRVANENPALYYEIQALNPHNKKSLSLLLKSIDDINNLVHSEDKDAFVNLMLKGREYLNSAP